eukprot:5840429-Alexandrium_andersonii.AAC.1
MHISCQSQVLVIEPKEQRQPASPTKLLVSSPSPAADDSPARSSGATPASGVVAAPSWEKALSALNTQTPPRRPTLGDAFKKAAERKPQLPRKEKVVDISDAEMAGEDG